MTVCHSPENQPLDFKCVVGTPDAKKKRVKPPFIGPGPNDDSLGRIWEDAFILCMVDMFTLH